MNKVKELSMIIEMGNIVLKNQTSYLFSHYFIKRLLMAVFFGGFFVHNILRAVRSLKYFGGEHECLVNI